MRVVPGFSFYAGVEFQKGEEDMAGYSGTPLIKKLGIKESFRVALVNSPKGFKKELGSLPDKAKYASPMADALDLILLFVNSEAELQKSFVTLSASLVANGMLWVAWPKKSSGVATDLSFTNVQRIGLDAGLVDVKICAVNDVWSGLKFVYRLKDRNRR
jgi:hypothetical protein